MKKIAVLMLLLPWLCRVNITTEPNTKVCGQWFSDGKVATTPNPPHQEMGPYCRTTNELGETFFSYLYNGEDCSDAKLEFRITQQ
jgi:hypothetical protein